MPAARCRWSIQISSARQRLRSVINGADGDEVTASGLNFLQKQCRGGRGGEQRRDGAKRDVD